MSAIKRRRREKLLLRVAKGGFIPADGYTHMRLRERGYKMDDVVLADLVKPRNPGFHRLAHRLGQLAADNIDEFEGLDGHAVLKRIQIEAGIACDEIPLKLPVIGLITYRVPRSLSFTSMDEVEFKATIRAMSEYIAKTYWPNLSPEQIEEMAEAMPEAA